MNKINRISNFLKNNLTIILFVIYAISFVNYFIYYKSFNISIFNYLSISDLLFFALEHFLKIILAIFLFEILFFIVYSCIFTVYQIVVLKWKKKLLFYMKSKKNRERINNLFNTSFDDGLIGGKFIVMILGIFAIGLLPFQSIIIPAYFVYFLYLLESHSEEKRFDISIPITLFIVFVIMLFSTTHQAYIKRFYKDDFLVSLIENDSVITTDTKTSTLNYLGETSTNIFFYDINSKKARIVFKSNIRNLEIQNNETLDNYIIVIRDNFFIQNFIKMLNDNK